jgi:hypothetical protein
MSTAFQITESQQRSAARSRDGRGFRAVRIVLGLLLVTAAGLKLYGFNVGALPRAGWFATTQVQVAAAEWELVLGLWLLSGAAQYAAWLTAISTFLGFAIVSAYFGWIGVASCGCFGAIKTSPWTVFAVDVVAISALLICRPRSNFARTLPSGSSAMIPIGAAAILVGLTIINPWIYGSSGTGQSGNLHWRRDVGLTITSLGRPVESIPVGSSRMFEILLQNNSYTPIALGPVETSCSCFSVNLPTAEIPPQTAVRATAIVDLASRPSFRGALTLFAEARVRGRSTITAFEIQFECEVE